MADIKFYFQEYRKGKYYSHKRHNYYDSTDIGDQVWISQNELCHGEQLDLYEIKRRLNPNVSKKERSIILRFSDVYEFVLKEHVPYDKWNGIVFADLDLCHSKTYLSKINAIKDSTGKIISYDKDKNNQFYNALYEILSNIIPNNFYMIEHSSSGVDVHIMFYYNVEKTEENFQKCAAYSKQILYDKISNNDYGIIQDFNIIIREREGIQKVMDPVIERAYQKCYITGIDWHINEFASGDISIEQLDKFEIKSKNEIVDNAVSYEIKSVGIKKGKKWLTDHNERFFIYTALKKVTKSKKELDIYWRELCGHFELYKDYTLNKFINEFNYDNIDANQGHVDILRKYGIDIDDSKHHIDLGDGYLGDKRDMILGLLKPGINFLQAPTCGGKTRFWTDLNIEYLNDVLNINKPILVIEPLNSIIDTKYNKNEVTVVTGSKRFPKTLIGYGMYVTNYNKLLKKSGADTWEMRSDIDEFLSQFGLIVLDESHILIKDSFRCNVLIPFIESINAAAARSKIILQTATPMNEDQLFFINNYIICHKKKNITTKWIYRRCIDDKFEISQLTCLVSYYVRNGRKVYIYWNNASLSQLYAFKSTYIDPNKVAIFHKRNKGEESMERILKFHRLKYDGNNNDKSMTFESAYEYDVLLSSVYFGVGNDLDDENDAAVIIIGNNTWQEDIQAVGRWRNSKDVEICQIILPNEYEFIEDTAKNVYDINKIRTEKRNILNRMWKDKLNKDKSVIINHKTYQITKMSDIEPLTVMSTADIYYSQFNVKINALSDEYYGYRIKNDYTKPLECNIDFTDANKEYWDSIKDERNTNKKNIMNGIIDYDIINKDTKLVKFKSLWEQLKRYEIDKLLGPKYITASTHYHILKCWIDYYKALLSRNADYPEIYALLWYRNRYDKETKDKLIDINGFMITEDEYNMFLSYVIFLHNKNKGIKDYDIKANYIMSFKFNCKLFADMPDKLIDKLYSTYDVSEIDITATKEFFSDYEWKDAEFESTIIHNMQDILKQTEHMNKEFSKVQFIFKMFFNNRKVSGYLYGKKSSPKKKVTIEESFNKPERYTLNIGQVFDSATDLAAYANVSNKTVTQWISKKWVSKSK